VSLSPVLYLRVFDVREVRVNVDNVLPMGPGPGVMNIPVSLLDTSVRAGIINFVTKRGSPRGYYRGYGHAVLHPFHWWSVLFPLSSLPFLPNPTVIPIGPGPCSTFPFHCW